MLYAGRLTRARRASTCFADAFLAARPRPAAAPRARRRRPGGGAGCAPRLGARDVPRLARRTELAAAYASADIFLFCSQTDTFGQVVLEAQASGLPVVAVAAGGPAELIADGRSGLLCAPRRRRSPGAVAGLAGSRAMRERLARGGLAAVASALGGRSLGRLAAGWRRALAPRRRADGGTLIGRTAPRAALTAGATARAAATAASPSRSTTSSRRRSSAAR